MLPPESLLMNCQGPPCSCTPHNCGDAPPQDSIRDGVKETWLAVHTLPPGLREARALVLSAEDSPPSLPTSYSAQTSALSSEVTRAAQQSPTHIASGCWLQSTLSSSSAQLQPQPVQLVRASCPFDLPLQGSRLPWTAKTTTESSPAFVWMAESVCKHPV